MTFRIFTNDRGKQRGVFMYSAWRDIESPNRDAAQSTAERLGAKLAYRGEHGPVKALPWPPLRQSDAEKEWARKYVGV